jgi:hypothetical protein
MEKKTQEILYAGAEETKYRKITLKDAVGSLLNICSNVMIFNP